ncbi:MAG: flagellar motor protein MotA [Solirubrobacterales bacterium]|nr:flagellar motor protein MotA [Solirubrobacterales bacterium]
MLKRKRVAPQVVRDEGGRRSPGGTRLRPSTRSIRLIVVAAAVLAAVVLAACGSSKSSSSSSSSSYSATPASESSGTKPTGSPIKTFTITSIQAQAVPTYPNIKETAVAYEKWINGKGGIKGHPLQITICDDRGEPTQATKCAREGVENGAVAGVGSFSFFGANIVPVLEKSKTAWFGICCAQSAQELSSKTVFPTGSQPAYGAATVAKAYEEGCKHLNAVIVEGAQGVFEPVMKNAAKAYNHPIGKFINLPTTVKDYSPQVAEALSGNADCVAVIFGESLFKAWMPAWQQSGTKARMYGAQGNLNAQATKGFESAAEGSKIVGVYPDLATKPWAEMREALKAANVNQSLDYDALASLGDWNGYVAFTKIAEKMTGTIDHNTFIEAASKTSGLETNGQVPTLDFTKEWTEGPKGFNRLFQRSSAFSKIEHGKVVPDTEKLYDGTKLMLGTGKLGPGV